jgi:hypothetical protein
MSVNKLISILHPDCNAFFGNCFSKRISPSIEAENAEEHHQGEAAARLLAL